MKRQIGLGIALALPLAITAWGCNGEQIESGVKSTGTNLEKAGGAIEKAPRAWETNQGIRHGLQARRRCGDDRRGDEKSGEKTREVLDKTGEK